MKHYRINKVARPGGPVIKKKDIVANTDRQAVVAAEQDNDCPVCEVWQAGEKVGEVQ